MSRDPLSAPVPPTASASRGVDDRERDHFRQTHPGPYAEGRSAYAARLDPSANPYAEGTDEQKAWAFGYADAKADG